MGSNSRKSGQRMKRWLKMVPAFTALLLGHCASATDFTPSETAERGDGSPRSLTENLKPRLTWVICCRS